MANDAKALTEPPQNIGDYVRDMWKYFFTAIELDKKEVENAKQKGTISPDPNKNIKYWFQKFGFGLVIGIVLIFGLSSLIRRPEKRRGGHHGINKYGERY